MDFTILKLALTDECQNCFDTFTNALKLNFPEFAMYQNGDFYFALKDIDIDEYHDRVNEYVNTFKCSEGETEIYETHTAGIETVVRPGEPSVSENFSTPDVMWINKNTGEIFISIDNTPDKNIWVSAGTDKIVQPVPPADKFDFFSDNRMKAFYKLDKNLNDVGGKYHGKDYGIRYIKGVDGFGIDYEKNGSVKIYDLPFNKDTDSVTVWAWVKWYGYSSVMPFGWDTYDIYVTNGYLGFNTANGDVTGIDFRNYKKKWVYLGVEFTKGRLGKIYVNGEPMVLDKGYGTFNADTATMSSKFSLFGWNSGSSYRRFGGLDRVRIAEGSYTDDQHGLIYRAEKALKDSLKELK